MKKAVMFSLLINLCLLMNAQVVTKTIPVTTSSEKALAIYNEAMNAYQDVDLTKYNELISKALREDPDFFMAYYHKAIFAAYLKQEKNMTEFATAAVNCNSKISPGEMILKSAVRKLLGNPAADLTFFGIKLVEMYPQDVNAYLNLNTFQYLKKDLDGEISTLNKALELEGRKDFIYNLLAYAYMEKGQFKEAEAALDTYIGLSPRLPNPYDSKGDLYMKTKEYAKAYENFMKANSIDDTWSKDKALKAKLLAESSSDNQLNQVDLMKIFVGKWQLEGSGRDTINIFEMNEYNNGLLQVNSRIIGGVKYVQSTCTYTYDQTAGYYNAFVLFPEGKTDTWHIRFSSDKEVVLERIEDLKTNNSVLRKIIFEDPDHLISNNYSRENVMTSASKWIRTSAPITNKASDLIGTYEYYGDQKGISIWNEKHFIWTMESKSSTSDSEINPQNRMNSMNVAGGTWTVQDSIVSCIYQYHINPKMVGTSFRFVYKMNGNIINSRFIDKEGKVIGRNSAIKIN